MLRLARFLARRTNSAVLYVQGSAESMPLPDSSLSLAWSIASVHHWGDLDASLQEVRRVLKPGGRLVAIERLTRPGASGLASHGWTSEQATAFADRCVANGFTDAKVSQADEGRRTMVTVTATTP
jgi:ubiquinone/menaquinone biosynthesis C-methylase UbiE